MQYTLRGIVTKLKRSNRLTIKYIEVRIKVGNIYYTIDNPVPLKHASIKIGSPVQCTLQSGPPFGIVRIRLTSDLHNEVPRDIHTHCGIIYANIPIKRGP